MYNTHQIAEITGSKLIGKNSRTLNFFLTDSRAVQSAADTLFIALKTGRNNGHNYIASLIASGVKSFLVQEGEVDPSQYKDDDLTFIISKNPLQSLQVLAKYHRTRFSMPVIGITGSNGKTVVKEWLYQILKKNYSICRSPKSYNSQIGVPLSILNLNETHTLGIFEAGISRPGEMEILADMIQPNFGILTSLGSAHDEGFESTAQKIEEKLKLFASCDKVVINGLDKWQLPAPLLAKSIVISESDDSDFKMSLHASQVSLSGTSGNYDFSIPFSDKASLLNAATCSMTLMSMGFKEAEVQTKLNELQPVALRLELKNGIHNSLLINDYYNSDLDSIKIALNYLQQQNRRLKKIVIISDVEQSGISASNLYKQLADLLSHHKIDLLIGVGKEIGKHRTYFKANSLFFDHTQGFISQFNRIDYQFSEAGILLKGARSFGFEQISRLLQLKSHDTVFEINLNRLTDNINYYRSLLSPHTQVMAMVKATGYGSGSSEIAKTLQHIGVNYLAVAYADEGVELRQSQITLPIMVMSPEEDAMDDLVSYNLEPEIYNLRVLRTFVAKLDAMGISEPYPVHIKIDTGMHRLGFEDGQLEELCSELKKLPQLKVKSVFSHLVGSDNPDLDDFTAKQILMFEKACSMLEKGLGYSVTKHLCNSGAISRFKQAHYNMVRLGIGMYGIGVNAAEQAKLENAGTLKTRISQIKTVKAGDTVGYNRNGKIATETRIATIPIGYADGYSRVLGNGKHGAYVKGVFCKTIGNICMDMTMIDISAVNCEEGDEVIIFETVEQISRMAQALNSISYEVLTSVSARVKRVYVQE